MTSSAIHKPDRVRRASTGAVRRYLAPACAALLVGTLGLGCAAYGDASDDVSPNPQAGDPAAGASATYTVTYTGAWTAAATPGGVPDGAHFSPLIGGVHNASTWRSWRPAVRPRQASKPWRSADAPPP